MRKFLDMKLELHKHRERKLTDLARERVNGQNPNSENVNSNEEEYLDSLCEVIENHRKKTLLEETIKNIKPVEKKTEIKDKKIEKSPIKESKSEKKKMPDEYIKVEVLEDLPTFTGMDAKNYTLKNTEKEIIPMYNAKILSDAGKVKIITEVKA